MGKRSVCNGVYSLVVVSGVDITDEFVLYIKHEVEGMCHFGEDSTNCNGGDCVN